MSLCHDFQKWTMITLASVAISLIVGLVLIAHGQTVDNQTSQIPQEQLNTERAAKKAIYELCIRDFIIDNGNLTASNIALCNKAVSEYDKIK